MKRKKETKDRNRKTEKFRFILGIGFFIFFFGIGLSRGDDWTPPPWGLNLEELNLIVKEKNKTGLIQEDKNRSEFELQYSNAKAIKVKRGKVVALIISSDASKPGRLYGYSFEGKFFGRVIFFKDHPEFFPETVPRTLKEKYPQGRILRSFSTASSISFFEYRTDQLYIFSTERGVFYYEPNVLEKVVRIEQGQNIQEEERIDREVREKGSTTP
jgi:hypothetical protein